MTGIVEFFILDTSPDIVKFPKYYDFLFAVKL